MRADRTETIWHGAMAGLIGYATVALIVGALDLMQGRSFFFTAALLGETLFYNLREPAQVVVWPGAVFAYNGLHLVTFLAFGMIAAWLAYFSERGPMFWYLGLVLFLVVFLHLFGAVLLMTESLRAAIPTYEIWIPSLAAVLAISGYLLSVQPRLRGLLTRWQEPSEAS